MSDAELITTVISIATIVLLIFCVIEISIACSNSKLFQKIEEITYCLLDKFLNKLKQK